MTGDVRGLSLWQPWASWLSLGVKRIETRSWPTRYRGRVLIHAAKRTPTVEGFATGAFAPEWAVFRLSEPTGPEWVVERKGDEPGHVKRWPLPLGAVVASGVLTDCVPIIGDMDPPPERGAYVEVTRSRLFLCGALGEFPGTTIEGRDIRSIDYDRPFGDYRPGRWAWLLADVLPTTERCPRCWATAWIEVMGVKEPCPECWIDDRPTQPTGCPPIPMRGRQGLWRPRWAGE